jgi:hypothetical protein
VVGVGCPLDDEGIAHDADTVSQRVATRHESRGDIAWSPRTLPRRGSSGAGRVRTLKQEGYDGDGQQVSRPVGARVIYFPQD